MPQPESLRQLGLFMPPAGAVPERRVWRVGELVGELRGQVEREYPDCGVEGEISNLRAAPSGHLYFTLKDGEAQLPVVLFRRQAVLLRFRPQDGQQVLVRGRVSIYDQRGQLQLIGETLQPRGVGSLQIAFEQLKRQLEAEGLFAAERKRTLPAFPRCIGIVTSPTGAVVRDFLTVAGRRHARLDVLLYPALVQGEGAAAEIAAGILFFNQARTPARTVDLIVIARGGGSLEDLQAFNTELLARAIARSELPVVSAVGHETDFTIADFVADLRAPTPSAAAELITEAQHRVEERLDELETRLARAARYRLMMAQERYARLAPSASFARLQDAFGRRAQRVDELVYRLERAWSTVQMRRRAPLEDLTGRLLRQDVTRTLRSAHTRANALEARLLRAFELKTGGERARLQRAGAQLEALSPLAVLERGYALVFGPDGELLRDADQTHAGQAVAIRLAKGAVTGTITGKLA